MFAHINRIIIACRSQDGHFHAVLDPRFEIDILVQIHIGPEINELDSLVSATDTIHSSESLNDSYRIPVNIIVDAKVAILKVLSLGYAVCTDQDVDLPFDIRHDLLFILGYRREAGKDIIEIRAYTG
jgi:hypothetical protein